MADDIVITIGGDVSKAEGMFGKLGGAVGGFTSMTLSNLNQVGSTFSNLGSRISEFTDEMVGNFAEFDKSMNTLSVISGEAADYLTDDFEAMSEKYGVATTSIVDATMEISAAGFDLAESYEMVNASMDMAAAGMSDVNTASTILVSTINQFSAQGYTAADIANIFAKAANETSLAVNDMGSAMGYVGANAAVLGYSLEDTASILGKLKDGGLNASMAGTYLRGMLVSLISPTSTAEELMSKYNIAIRDAEGSMLPLVDIVDNVEAALVNESKAVKDAAISTLFGVRGQTAYNTIVLQGTDSVRALSDGLNEAGYAQKMAADMTDNMATQLAKLNVELDNAKRKFGEDFIPATEFAIETEIAFYDIIGKLPGPLLEIGGGMAVIAGKAMETIGPMIQMATSIMTLIMLKNAETASTSGGTIAKIAHTIATWAATAATWAWNAALMANPIVWIIIAIAALIAALYLLWKHWDEVTAAVKGVWDVLINWLKPAIDAVGGAMAWFNDHIITPISDALTWLYEHILVAIGLYLYVLKLAWEALGNGLKWVYENTMKPVFDALAWVYNNVIKPIANTIGGFFGGAGNFFGGMGESITFAAKGLYAPGPMLTMIGETEPEWVIPQSKVGSFIGAMTSGGGGGGDTWIIENLNVKANTPEELIRALKSETWRGKRVGA